MWIVCNFHEMSRLIYLKNKYKKIDNIYNNNKKNMSLAGLELRDLRLGSVHFNYYTTADIVQEVVKIMILIGWIFQCKTIK